MKTRNVAVIVLGCLLALPGLALFLAGGAVGVMSLTARGDDGWLTGQVDPLESSGVAVTAEDLLVDVNLPKAVADRFDLDMRLTARSVNGKTVFVGVAPNADLNTYLGGAAHHVITDISDNGTATYASRPGSTTVAPPAAQTIWDARSTGTSVQQLTWTAHGGNWSVAVMNADGSAGVAVAMTAGVRWSAIGPIGWVLMAIGLLLLGIGIALIVLGARRGDDRGGSPPAYASHPATSMTPADSPASSAAYPWVSTPTITSPVAVDARLDPGLSRGLWLVKWFLAIPHFIVLAFLGFASFVASVCAWFAILITGRYPRGLFDFNVGVLRWSWRVSYYAGSGGLGTDRYPAFGLAATAEDATHLDIAYPEHLSRGLIFVKWLLLLPHWVILAVLTGPAVSWVAADGEQWRASLPGLLSVLAFVVGVILLFTGAYPRGLFGIIVGLNRWIYRVIAYGALMTDVYPPFRLDEGGSEPPRGFPPPTGPSVSGAAPDGRVPVGPDGAGPVGG